MRISSGRGGTGVAALVLLAFGAGSVLYPAAAVPAGSGPSKLVARLMGPGLTETVNHRAWSADLGALAFHADKLCLLVGDTLGLGIFSPNVLATSADLDARDGLDLRWRTNLDGTPKSFFPRIEPDSTVPAGALSLNGALYVFMMDVTHWADAGADRETRARSLLAKSTDDGEHFGLVWLGAESSKFINIAPVVGADPSDPARQGVFLFGSGHYRTSPVYLAFAAASDLEFPNRWYYFRGFQGTTPRWTLLESEAVPIVEGVEVGELSAVWNGYLNKYLLAFFDYGRASSYGLYFRAAEKPWGPWSAGRLVFDGTARADWYEPDWHGPYGGYLLRQLDRENGRLVHYTLSLWVPYSIFLMQVDLADVFTKKGAAPR